MTAVVVGADLGLGNSSLNTLGLSQGSAAQGQAGEKVFVNLGTGNLVLQQQDEMLFGPGTPMATLRTYNSLGVMDGDNNDNWRIGFYRQLGSLTGTLGTAGSSIIRSAADGASERYVWDAAKARYVCTDGAGVYRSLSCQADGSWLWQDGQGATESYQSQGGSALLLRSQLDGDGNLLRYEYAANGLLQKVISDSGESTELVYDSMPGREANLLSIRTVTLGVGTGNLKLQTRVRYDYDDLNRLKQVTVDLSPQDDSTADGQVYITRYTYDGSSKRVASLWQSDGGSLSFSYDSAGRVASVTDALGAITRYTYEATCSTVTDALGNVTRYNYDASLRLASIESPAANSVTAGVTATQRFQYNDNGDLILATAADGAVTQYEYDGMGNQTVRRDALAEVRMEYNARNQLLSETRTPVGNSGPALITRYVYDASGLHLRFLISAQGRVTQYRYNSLGQRGSSIVYSGNTWSGTLVPDESAMSAWADALADKSQAVRTDYRYDFRGQLAASTVYSRLDSLGNGVADGAAATLYGYDAAGRLLYTQVPGTGALTRQIYDGLGRVLARTNALGQITSYAYVEGADATIPGSVWRIVQTAANGSMSSSIFDRAGRLIASSATNSAGLGITHYSYDANGRLRAITDATGVSNWLFYDALGRKSAELDGNGSLVEFRYDVGDRLVQTLRYAAAVTVGISMQTVLEQIRPTADAQRDQLGWQFYDSAGRLSKSVDAKGAVTQLVYDSAGRVQRQTRYANVINTGGLVVGTAANAIQVQADAARDRITRYFYDNDGLLRGTLDAEGYLTEVLYDGAGRAWQNVAYANAVGDANPATLDAARPLASNADIRSFTLYDGRGLVVGEIDGENYLTEHAYDANGNRLRSTRFHVAMVSTAGLTSSSDVSSLRPAGYIGSHTSQAIYDALNRVVDVSNFEGVHTRYEYNSVGNVFRTTAAWGDAEARVQTRNYDAQGLLLTEWDGEGRAVRYSYDLAGRRIAMTDTNGSQTRYYFDKDGRLCFTINALGEVEGRQYDALGQVVSQTRYAKALGSTIVAGLKGGLVNATLTDQIAILASADDSTKTWSCNRDGSVALSADELGYTTQYRYNNFGERVGSTAQLEAGKSLINGIDYDRRGLQIGSISDVGGINAVNSSTYDAIGRRVSSTDALGGVTRFIYDRLGRQVQSIDPLNISRAISYDAFGRVLTQTDGNGKTSTTQYKDATRTVVLTTPEEFSFRTQHNRHGETSQSLNSSGVSYSYDRSGRLTSKYNLYTVGRETDEFDVAGNLIQHTDALGIVTTIRYDAARRVLSRTIDPSGLALTTSYSYDAKGQLIRETAPDGTVTQTVYDRRGQVQSVTRDANGLKLRTTYAWDARGLMLSVTEADGTPAASTTVYAYDALGRRISETVDPAGLNLTTRYAWDANGQMLKKTDAAGNATRYVYDADGRMQYQIDPMGAVTAWRYEGEGRPIAVMRYARTVDVSKLADVPTASSIMDLLGSAPAEQITRTVYDGDGRAAFQIDALGQVTRKEFDGLGNVLRETRYAKAINLDGDITRAQLETALAAVAGKDDRVQRNVYDGGGRLIYTLTDIDKSGVARAMVTAYTWDLAGNLLQKFDYLGDIDASVSADQTSVSNALTFLTVSGNFGRKTTWVYDAAGRAVYIIDPMSYVVQQDYDGTGRLLRSLRYANPVSLGTTIATVASVKALLNATTMPPPRVETKTWDRAGRLIDSTDGLGFVTHREYDAAGHLTDLTVAAGTPSQVRTHYDYDAAGRLVARTEAADTARAVTTRMRYDGLGHLIATVEARGVELAEQDSDWALSQRKASGLVDANGQARLSASLTQAERESLLARYTSFKAYDSNGRVIRETDALGGVKLTEYDAFGNVKAITDSRGYRGTFAYDALNRLTLQIDPEGQATTTGYTLGDKIASVTQGSAVTSFVYDKLDRLIRTTDAEGYSETRDWNNLGELTKLTNKLGGVTEYDHDRLGRLVWQRQSSGTASLPGTPANVTNSYEYDGRGNLIRSTEAAGLPEQRVTIYTYDAANRLLVKALQVPSGSAAAPALVNLETNVYDARGNLIETRDANGHRKLAWYDERDRKIAEMDAVGTLTTWTYTAGAQAVAKTVYADALALPSTPGGTPPVPLNPLNARQTQFEFDANGRLTASTIRSQTIGRYNVDNGQYQLSTADIVSRQVYDAAGNVVQVVDPNGNVTRFWYDRLGQKILQVDAEGYGTAWRYDANGHVLTETRFAQRAAGLLDPAADGVSLAAAWTASSEDRITRYSYDRNGRLLEERHVSVAYGVVNATGGLATGTQDAVTTYTWNGLGLLTQKTDATGSVWTATYDRMGRKTSEQGPSFTDFEGALVKPRTDFEYDGLGNLRSLSRRGKDDTSTTDDQITLYTYGANGRIARETDPMGVATEYQYDAVGNVILKSRQRSDADGRKTVDSTSYRYDDNNREIEQTDTATGTSRQTRYNAFGEVIGRGTNGGWQEFAEYDAPGRLVKGNSGDGVTKAYVYDAAGNASLKIESSGVDLRALSLDRMLQLANVNAGMQAQDAAQVHLTISAYDRRNQLTDTWQPKMVSSAANAESATDPGGTIKVEEGRASGVKISTGDAGNVGSVPLEKREPGYGITLNLSAGWFGTLAVSQKRVAFIGDYWDTFTLSVPESLDMWGEGNIRVELQQLNTGRSQNNYYPVGTRAVTVQVLPQSFFGYSPDSMGPLAIRLYKNTVYGEVLVSQIITSGWNVGGAPIATLALFKQVRPEPASVLLYYRPIGSTAAFQVMQVPPYLALDSGMHAFDWKSLPLGNYEVRILAVSGDGLMQDIQTGVISIGADSAGASIQPAAFGPRSANSLVFQSGHLLQVTSQGSKANSLSVRYRLAGSNGPWSSATVVGNSDAPGAVTPGWFTVDYGSRSGDYDVILETHVGAKGEGELISKTYVTLRLGDAPKVLSELVPFQSRPSTIGLAGMALSASAMALRYRVQGSNAAWSSVTLAPVKAGSGQFLWDAAELLAGTSGNVRYEFEYEAITAAGLVTNRGGGGLQLGSDTQLLSQYVTPGGSQLRFLPQIAASLMRIQYRPATGQGSFSKVIELQRAADGSFTWDMAALMPAIGSVNLEYTFVLLDANGQTLGGNTGYLELNSAIPDDKLQWMINSPAAAEGVIHRRQSTNAFGEIAQETDGLGRVTNFSYNTLGLLTQRLQPTTSATLENGFVKTLRPETRYIYDLAGHAVAQQDANGLLNTQAWLTGSFEKNSLVRQADGSLALYRYDIFGNLRSARDALGRVTSYFYDRNNRLIRIVRPIRDAGSPSAFGYASEDRYEYDEVGNRIAHTNALGQRERTYYDSLGRVVLTASFESRVTSYAYQYSSTLRGLGGAQTGGMVKTTFDANGRGATESTDMFGRLLSHMDFGGHTFDYRYNNAGWLTSQTGSTGQNINYEYYANGMLRRIRDLALHTLSSYEYDVEGNKTFEGYALLGADNISVRDATQQARIRYDELNRVQSITDPRYDVSYEYDAAGNRRRMFSRYRDISGAMQTQEYWYTYDAANRFSLSMGVLSGARATQESDKTVSIVANANSVQLGYDLAGQRRMANYAGADGARHTEQYTYTADGYLEDTYIDGILRARRQSDAAGRVVRYFEFRPSGTLNSTRNSIYDADGLLKREVTAVEVPDDPYAAGGSLYDKVLGFFSVAIDVHNQVTGQSLPRITRNTTIDYGRLADGTVNYSIATDDGGTTTNTYYGYEWWDSAKQSTITAQPYNDNAPGWKAGTSHLLYDVNGHLKEARDEAGKTGFRYTTNAEGLILSREEYMPNALRLQRYYYLDGKRVGDVGNGGSSRVDYVQALAQDGVNKTGPRSFSPINSADFDQNYEPINAAYPGSTSSAYIVRAGDTLRSIADQLWGDASMWYLIADANGLTGNEALTAGISLTIPNKVASFHNTGETFRVYNPGEAIGDISPNLPVPPPPPQDDDWGVLGIVMVVAVAAVVTVFTAGTMTAAAGSSLSAIMSAGTAALGTNIGVSLVAGAVGGAFSQVAGMAMGMQDGFSWTGVALSSLGAGVGAGIGGSGVGASVAKAIGFSGPVAVAATSQFLGNYVTQGLAMATGLQQKFDWRSVAVATLGAAAGSVIGEALKSSGATAAMMGSRMASGVVRAAMGGNWAAVAAATIGNALVEMDWSGVARGSMGARDNAQTNNAASRSGPGMTEEEFWNKPVQTTADQYANTYGGRTINTGDVLRLGSESNSINMEDAVRWADEQNADIIREAVAQGRSLAPTIKNAQDLQLWDTSNAQQFPTRMLAHTDATTSLIGLGFGTSVIQDTSTWGDEFMRGYLGEYRSVMEGPAPAAETVGRYAGQVVNSFENFALNAIGARSMNAGIASFKAGNYAIGALQTVRAFGEAGLTVLGLGVGSVASPGTGVITEGLGTAAESAAMRSEAAANIRQARGILADTRPDLTIGERNQIIKSFDLMSFRVNTLSSPVTEFRYYDGLPSGAGVSGRWSTPAWYAAPADRISNLALPNNQATYAATVQLQPGTTVFQGLAAPQLKFGPSLTGSGLQTYNAAGPRAIIKELP